MIAAMIALSVTVTVLCAIRKRNMMVRVIRSGATTRVQIGFPLILWTVTLITAASM